MTDTTQTTEPVKISNVLAISGPDYLLNGIKITSLIVNPMRFEAFVDATSAAVANAKNNKEITKLIWRERVIRQVVCGSEDNKRYSLNLDHYGAMPSLYAMQLKKRIDQLDAAEPTNPHEIVTSGDGLTTPILFKLGTPIKLSADKVVTELEFLMSDMNAVEDFLVLDNPYKQALHLIKSAKPYGTDITLLALPSAAVSAISLDDGMAISNEIVPKIVGEENE